MTLLRTQALNILESALRSEVGITCDVDTTRDISGPSLRAKQALYRFRSELSPRFDGLKIDLSPSNPNAELWIYHEGETNHELDPRLDQT